MLYFRKLEVHVRYPHKIISLKFYVGNIVIVFTFLTKYVLYQKNHTISIQSHIIIDN